MVIAVQYAFSRSNMALHGPQINQWNYKFLSGYTIKGANGQGNILVW